MLKLKILFLFAAAANIALTTPAIPRTRSRTINPIRQGEAFRNTFFKTLKDTNPELVYDVRQITQSIKQSYTSASPIIDFVIQNATVSFNKTVCRSYFDSYEQIGKEVINILKLLYPEAFKGATTSLTNEFSAHPEVLENLDNHIIQLHNKEAQENRAGTCTENQCVENLIRDSSSGALVINGTYFQHPKYDEFRKKERNLFTETLTCLRINLPHKP